MISILTRWSWETRTGRTPHDNEGGDWSDAAKSQGMLKTVADYQDSPAGFRVSMALISDF